MDEIAKVEKLSRSSSYDIDFARTIATIIICILSPPLGVLLGVFILMPLFNAQRTPFGNRNATILYGIGIGAAALSLKFVSGIW